MRSECDRTKLIAELASLLRDCELPDEARAAGLTLIGFLARRMPGEEASNYGVAEVRAAFARCEARRAMLTERAAGALVEAIASFAGDGFTAEVASPDSGERSGVAAPSSGEVNQVRPKGSAAA